MFVLRVMFIISHLLCIYSYCTEYQYLNVMCLKVYFPSPFFSFDLSHVVNSLLSHSCCYFDHSRSSGGQHYKFFRGSLSSFIHIYIYIYIHIMYIRVYIYIYIFIYIYTFIYIYLLGEVDVMLVVLETVTIWTWKMINMTLL